MRAFALYYFPALEGLLPQDFYHHFLYLVYGLQVLLQENVSLNLVEEIDLVFRHFVKQADVLYGEKHMRFNMHLLTHLSQSVINWGCLTDGRFLSFTGRHSSGSSVNFIPVYFTPQCCHTSARLAEYSGPCRLRRRRLFSCYSLRNKTSWSSEETQN